MNHLQISDFNQICVFIVEFHINFIRSRAPRMGYEPLPSQSPHRGNKTTCVVWISLTPGKYNKGDPFARDDLVAIELCLRPETISSLSRAGGNSSNPQCAPLYARTRQMQSARSLLSRVFLRRVGTPKVCVSLSHLIGKCAYTNHL